MELATRIDSPSQLASQDRDAMFELMTRHYDHVSRVVFERDLSEKRWVIRLRQIETGRLCGFSTQMVLKADVDGRSIRALFSGDTIVDRPYWGSTALSIAWGRLALDLVDRDPDHEWYWFLICKGFRTYRFLPVFFNEYFPRHDCAWPDHLRRIIDHLAGNKFGSAYDPSTGIIQTQPDSYWLRAENTDQPSRRRDPNVDFFLSSNPHYRRGDELCCLAPLSRNNFSPAARRLMAAPAFLRAGSS